MSGQLPAYPVVPVHLEHPAGSGLAACCGLPMPTRPDHEYPVGTVLWTCTGCWGPMSWNVRERDEPWERLRALMLANPDWWWELRWDPPVPGPEGYALIVWRGARGHAFQVGGAVGVSPYQAVRMAVERIVP